MTAITGILADPTDAVPDAIAPSHKTPSAADIFLQSPASVLLLRDSLQAFSLVPVNWMGVAGSKAICVSPVAVTATRWGETRGKSSGVHEPQGRPINSMQLRQAA